MTDSTGKHQRLAELREQVSQLEAELSRDGQAKEPQWQATG